MKRYLLALSITVLGLTYNGFAQTTQMPYTATTATPQATQQVVVVNSAYISELQKLNIYVSPNNGQSATQTQVDETDCYSWAVQQTGYDPLNPPAISASASAPSVAGGAIRGAAIGSAEGAAVGAIAGNAGKGAAIGATVGGVHGIGQASQEQAAAQQQAQQQVQQQYQNLNTNFTKAFSACMSSKGYSVN